MIFTEIIIGGESYAKSDIWSAGICVYVMLFRQLPFYSESAEVTKWNIKNRDLVWPVAISGEAKDQDADKRSGEQDHVWGGSAASMAVKSFVMMTVQILCQINLKNLLEVPQGILA